TDQAAQATQAAQAAPPTEAAPTAPPNLLPGVVVSPGGTGDRPASYVYSVESNYPVTLLYTGENGDQITDLGEVPPWSITVPTAEWGADATPMLVVSTTSAKGDTSVTCTIAAPDGTVLATDTKEAAYASATCMIYDFDLPTG
ncbi:hypothetical protein, partial [Pseudonocardia lacus]|uniref:hypothetical protein n=1 Tax=Pseudonocardia lacus TaxID=2835865 RepID=UPI001BDDAB93